MLEGHFLPRFARCFCVPRRYLNNKHQQQWTPRRSQGSVEEFRRTRFDHQQQQVRLRCSCCQLPGSLGWFFSISPIPEKVQAVRDFEQPKSTQGKQQFLGMIHFYHCFIPQSAAVLGPLHDALRVSSSPRMSTGHTSESMHSLKQRTFSPTMLWWPIQLKILLMHSQSTRHNSPWELYYSSRWKANDNHSPS